MTTRTRLLATLAVALLVLTFHIRLKKEPDYEFINEFAAESVRQRDWIGRYPPELDLKTIDGQPFKLSDHVGREVVVLNFFATWCAPCRAEMPELQRFVTAHKGQPVTFVAIDAHEDPGLVKQYRDKAKFTFPIVIAPDDVLKQFAINSYPTTILIEPMGTVRLYETGAIANTDVTLEPILRDALPVIAQHRGISKEAFLKKSSEDVSRPTTADRSSGPKLTGRALQIAQTMDCVCGCKDTVEKCNCNTATKMKQKLAKGDFGGKTDAQIKTALNAEFCMKEGM